MPDSPPDAEVLGESCGRAPPVFSVAGAEAGADDAVSGCGVGLAGAELAGVVSGPADWPAFGAFEVFGVSEVVDAGESVVDAGESVVGVGLAQGVSVVWAAGVAVLSRLATELTLAAELVLAAELALAADLALAAEVVLPLGLLLAIGLALVLGLALGLGLVLVLALGLGLGLGLLLGLGLALGLGLLLGLAGELAAGVDGVDAVDAADECDGLGDTAAEAGDAGEHDVIGVGWRFEADVLATPAAPPRGWPPPAAAELAALVALWPSKADETVELSA